MQSMTDGGCWGIGALGIGHWALGIEWQNGRWDGRGIPHTDGATLRGTNR
ncbi:MAG: hypothetical protein HFH39_00315 [Lachnospiraceae bacterium]|nr:hypothetical protein [Lachnospiraceae bacterium]